MQTKSAKKNAPKKEQNNHTKKGNETQTQNFLPPEKQYQLIKQQMHVAMRESRSAPLPTPEEFGQYDKILPGAANRILEMAESEQRFRHNLNNNQIEKEYKLKSKGLWFAFIIINILLLSTIILYWLSKNHAIAIALILEISIIAGLFTYWTRKDNREKTYLQNLKKDIELLKRQQDSE